MTANRAIILVLITGLQAPGCGTDSPGAGPGEWAGAVEEADGVTVVRNPAEPLLGELVLELEEDLVLGDTLHEESFFFNLISAGVDGRGNIFIWDPDSYRIQVFRADGRFLRTVGREGEGPGEFSDAYRMSFRVLEDGRLVVLEGGRLQYFGPSGEHVRTLPYRPTSTRFAVLSRGLILVDRFSVLAAGPVEEVALSDEDGQPVRTLASYPSEKWKAAMVDRLRFTHLAPELVLEPWGADGAVFGYPLQYRLTLVGGDGQVRRVIEVAGPALEVAPDLQDALLEDASAALPGSSPRDLKGEVYLPETWPFFDAVFTDEAGSLLVQRSEPLPAGSERYLDLFTAEGLYLYRVRVPVGDIQAVRNGFLYARRFDRGMNASQLVRYRILNWTAVTGAARRHRLPF